MSGSPGLHPFFRHFQILLCAMCATVTVILSFVTNVHSGAWLIGVYISLGLFLVALRSARKSPLHRTYALYLGTLIQYLLVIWFVHVYVPGSHPEQTRADVNTMTRILCLGSVFMPVALFHFMLRFSNVNWRPLNWIEYSGWIGCALFYISNLAGRYYSDFRWTGYTWVPGPGGTYAYFFYFTSFFVTMAMVIPAVKMYFSETRQRRLQLFYFLLGGMPLWLACWGNFLMTLGINIYPAGGVIFLLHAVIMAYAVFQKRLFDVTFVIRRGLAYAILSLVIGILYGGTLLILSSLAAALQASILSSVAFVFVVAFLYAPLLTSLQDAIDRVFFRASVNRQQMIEQFSRESAATIDLETLTRALCGLFNRSLNPRRTTLFLEDGKGELVQYCSQDGKYAIGLWPKGPKLPPEFELNGKSVKRVNIMEPVNTSKTVHLSIGDDAIVVPLRHQDRQFGCLLLESKRSDEPYDDEDIRLAETIAAQSAVALQNARSFTQLHQLQKFTQTTLEGLTTGIIVVSSAERIVQANRAARAICGVGESFPSNLDALSNVQASLGSEIRFLLESRQAHDDVELKIEGSRSRTLLLSSRQLGEQDGESLCLIILYDITNYKELENTAIRRESLAQIGEAISNINHEIKNVLQPVRYQISNLLRAGVTESNIHIQQAMTIIPERLGALEQLLANLKDLSRPVELRLRKFDAQEMVEAAWRDVNELPAAKAVNFKIIRSITVECTADGTLLRQVLFNVLRNAAEATIGRTRSEVSVEIITTDSEIKFLVEDNGCGISEEAKAKLFVMFYSTKDEAGTGLGLSICRKIVELHGGNIVVDSRLDVGTCVTISVPNRASPGMVEPKLPLAICK